MTIEEAVEATEDWKTTMEKHVDSGITQFEGLFQEQYNLDAANAGEIYRKHGEDCQALDALLTQVNFLSQQKTIHWSCWGK